MKKKNFNVYKLLIYMFFIILSLCFLIPFIMVISVSLSNEQDILEFGYSLLPRQVDFTAYRIAFKVPEKIIDAYMVTIFSTVSGTVMGTIIMALAGYSLAQEHFAGKRVLAFFIFFTMLFNGGLIPTYIINTKYLGLKDTLTVHAILNLVTPWYIFIFRTFFAQIPKELRESAIIDGASQLKVFIQIILPLSKPVLATVALLTALTRWNDWTTSLYYITEPKLYSLQYLLQNLLNQVEFIKQMMMNMSGNVAGMLDGAVNTPTESLRFAMCVIAAGPMLIVFPFFQKYFSKGLTVGSVKG